MGSIKDERGAALPAVIAVLLLVALLGTGAIAFAVKGAGGAENMQANQTAQENAENGLEAAKFQLASAKDPAKYDGKGAGDYVWAEAKGGKKLRFNGDSADRYTLVTIKPSKQTGKFDIVSTGYNDGTKRRLAAVVDASAPAVPPRGSTTPPAATTPAAPPSAPPGGTTTPGVPPTGEPEPPTPGGGTTPPAPGTTTPGTTTPGSPTPPEPPPPDTPMGERNREPVARDDGPQGAYTMREDAAERRLNVLVNDDDPDGDPIRVVSRTKATHGNVRCFPAYCTYKPVANYSGADSFRYTITDPLGKRSTATVRLRITPMPDKPKNPPRRPRPPRPPDNDGCSPSSGGAGQTLSVGGPKAGAQNVDGTDGNDTFYINVSGNAASINVDGGGGNDRFVVTGKAGGGASINLSGGGGDDYVEATVSGAAAGVIQIDGDDCDGPNAGDDTLVAKLNGGNTNAVEIDGDDKSDYCRVYGGATSSISGCER